MTETKESTRVEPIPDTDPSSPTPSRVESDDERAARLRRKMKALAAASRAMIVADLVAQTRDASPTGRDDMATDEASPFPEEVAAQVYLRTALLASTDLTRACQARQDEMRAVGASADEVLDALLNMARAHNGSPTTPNVPTSSFDTVMTAWERNEDPVREIPDA